MFKKFKQHLIWQYFAQRNKWDVFPIETKSITKSQVLCLAIVGLTEVAHIARDQPIDKRLILQAVNLISEFDTDKTPFSVSTSHMRCMVKCDKTSNEYSII